MIRNHKDSLHKRFPVILPYLWPALAVGAGLYLLLAPSQPTTVADSSVQAASDRNEIEQISLSWEVTSHATRNIEDIRVGDRVLAANPEITEEERATWAEPDWQQWMKLSLLMPKPDGSELEIEMLRPDEWVISQTRFVVEDRPADSVETPVDEPDGPALGESPVPQQPVYRHLGSRLELIDAMGLQVVAVTIEMDLPELGITGDAILVEIEPAPAVESGAGSVVTATFHHSSGDVIDLVLADKDGTHETIGTTTNHPFWSDDRQEYIQAGALESGEAVLTYAGDTKRVVSKLARPGPEPVYNLEVHGEHVYFVGQDGVLVHNSNNYAPNSVDAYPHAIGPSPEHVRYRSHSSAPSPRGTSSRGVRVQSHHPMQQEWAKRNLAGYDGSKAPTLTLETKRGLPHSEINKLQMARERARRAAGHAPWSHSVDQELRNIVDDFRHVGFSDTDIHRVLQDQYKMLDKLGVQYTKPGGF